MNAMLMELIRKLVFLILGITGICVVGKLFKNVVATVACAVILYVIYRFWFMI